MKKINPLYICMLAAVSLFSLVSAHCQVPCGIYGDEARFAAMLEDTTTIAKAVTKISSGKESQEQVVRWVLNKEKHAQSIQQTVLDYFLAQRIKADAPHYEQHLKSAHKIIVLAMKNKQQTSAKLAAELEQAIKDYEKVYFAK